MSAYVLTGIERIAPGSRRLRLHIEGAGDFCLYPRELRRLGWSEGTLITEDEYDSFINEVIIPRAKSRALHIIERMDRTRSDLERKLTENGYPEVAVDAAVEYASEYRYVDDERYTRNYIYFHKSDRSRRRIFTDLLKKGVDKDLVNRLLDEEYDTDEAELICSILDRRHYDPYKADQKLRSRTWRYLLGKGFSSEAIREAMAVDE